jgi:hypothetical protein
MNHIGIVGKFAVNYPGVVDPGNGGAAGEKNLNRRDDAIVVDEAMLFVGSVDKVSEDFSSCGNAHHVGVG